MKTYNDFLMTEYADPLQALAKLGAQAEFVEQDYGTQMSVPPEHYSRDGSTPNSLFVDIERRVELRVTMPGSYYSLRWSRDSELLSAFDMARAASMAKRFAQDMDSLVPLLQERQEYMKVRKTDINDPINNSFFDTVYGGSDDDIWAIQNYRIGNGINKLDDVLNAATFEVPGVSLIRQMEILYRGSKRTCTMTAIFNTVMNLTLVHTDTDYRERHIYDVLECEGLQIKVSYDEDGVLFRPTHFGEDLTEDLSRSLLSLDGECLFASELGGESLLEFWEDLGCSFEEFDDAQWNVGPVAAFKKFKQAPHGSGVSVAATAETVMA